MNEWIRTAYPSKRRQGRSMREGPEIITRLRVVVEGSDAGRVRTATEEALESIGLALSGSPPSQARRVVGAFHRSLVGPRFHVSLWFSPPIHVSSCKGVVERMGRRLRILAVSVKEERARLPPKPE